MRVCAMTPAFLVVTHSGTMKPIIVPTRGLMVEPNIHGSVLAWSDAGRSPLFVEETLEQIAAGLEDVIDVRVDKNPEWSK